MSLFRFREIFSTMLAQDANDFARAYQAENNRILNQNPEFMMALVYHQNKHRKSIIAPDARMFARGIENVSNDDGADYGRKAQIAADILMAKGGMSPEECEGFIEFARRAKLRATEHISEYHEYHAELPSKDFKAFD